MTTTLYLTAF